MDVTVNIEKLAKWMVGRGHSKKCLENNIYDGWKEDLIHGLDVHHNIEKLVEEEILQGGGE